MLEYFSIKQEQFSLQEPDSLTNILKMFPQNKDASWNI